LEKNKTGKYFKYAIGEIILVVIGILIALQINTWNENRKLNVTTIEYVENLKSDIVQDTIGLNDLIRTGKNHIKEIENFKAYLLQSNDSLSKKIDSSLNLIVGFYRYFPVNQTYLDMQSSGSSKLLSQNQRNVLNSLIKQQNRINKANETYINWAIEEITNRNKYMDEYGLINKVLGKPSTLDEMKLILRHQLNFLNIMEDMARTLTRFANEAKSTSDIVIRTL
jgi:hypothetical protein